MGIKFQNDGTPLQNERTTLKTKNPITTYQTQGLRFFMIIIGRTTMHVIEERADMISRLKFHARERTGISEYCSRTLGGGKKASLKHHAVTNAEMSKLSPRKMIIQILVFGLFIDLCFQRLN